MVVIVAATASGPWVQCIKAVASRAITMTSHPVSLMVQAFLPSWPAFFSPGSAGHTQRFRYRMSHSVRLRQRLRYRLTSAPGEPGAACQAVKDLISSPTTACSSSTSKTRIQFGQAISCPP